MKKDNPVPSLDKIKICLDLLEQEGIDYDSRQFLKETLNEILQNGVETDKGQPEYVELILCGKLAGVYSSEEAATKVAKEEDINTYCIVPIGTFINTDLGW